MNRNERLIQHMDRDAKAFDMATYSELLAALIFAEGIIAARAPQASQLPMIRETLAKAGHVPSKTAKLPGHIA